MREYLRAVRSEHIVVGAPDELELLVALHPSLVVVVEPGGGEKC